MFPVLMESVINEFCPTLYPLPHSPEGWLLGTNRDFITASGSVSGNYFGFDLGYDKNGVLGTYTPQYNGNIRGMLRKSEGDGEKRKYDYDNVNRLMNADFGQCDGSAFNTGAGVDFSMHLGNGADPQLRSPKESVSRGAQGYAMGAKRLFLHFP